MHRLYFNGAPPLLPVSLAGSKSIAARALVLSHVFLFRMWLDSGCSDAAPEWCMRLKNLPLCDDAIELRNALDVLRNDIFGNQPAGTRYYLGMGGTSLRFFLALAASLPGFNGVIDCGDALKKRPLKPLLDALRCAGADIECLESEGCAPLRVKGKILSGTHVTVDLAKSSQFASALLMASQLWSDPFHPEADAENVHNAVSRPYYEMTRRMVEIFRNFYCHANLIANPVFNVESDWSGAAFFYEYALLRPGVTVEIQNFPPLKDSLQGDSACCSIFQSLGVETRVSPSGTGIITGNPEIIAALASGSNPFPFDLCDTPDIVPALAVGMCLAGIRFEITGIAHLRLKESDRINSLSMELRKLGFVVDCVGDRLLWRGVRCAANSRPPIVASHGDHRIAMALAVAAAKIGGLQLADADVVTKSFPDFFAQLGRLGVSSIR
ncbi:MAG: hypothetical protein NC204_07745 [Candidatus Amulumruptor caecigallinarius]|nr:hypothetical protein [Candidatus Amulumruptor caecigallinarius]